MEVPKILTENSDDFVGINALQTQLCVLMNPAIHGDQGMSDVQRLNAIDETLRDLEGYFDVGGSFYKFISEET